MKKTIGIVGGGQLGRMLAIAAQKLGFKVIVLDPTPQSPAGLVADRQILGDFKDALKIKEIAELADTITFEIESANADALEDLVSSGFDIHPSPSTLSIIKDKFKQKKFLEKYGIPVADSLEVKNKKDIQKSAVEFGYPLLLKARSDAYDGRGNALIKKESEIDAALEKLKARSLYVEKFVPFTKELAVVVARDKKGTILPYPAVETIHKNNICHIVVSPAPIDQAVEKKANDVAIKVMNCLKGVGVFCIEMFLTSSGEVIVNEIAPRVHNSGHHSIESCNTSQFEQHIRAVAGLPLGTIEKTTPYAVMVNILGERSGPASPQGLEEVLKIAGTSVHIYNKQETRPERKMGHITVIGDNLERVMENALQARKMITI